MLLFAKLTGVRNSVLSTGGGLRERALAFLVLGGLFWGGTFAAVHWFIDQCQRVELFGDVLVEQLIGMVFLIILSVLFFSNLVASFSTYFLSDDLQFLMSRPIAPYSFFSARFLELLFQSSWMVALFSLPVFVSVGIVYELDFWFYLRVPATLLPILLIATSTASLVSFLLTNLLPARRTREALLLLVALTFVVLFVMFRSLQPERFLNPDDRSNIVEILSTFQAPRVHFLPSEWAFRSLWPDLLGLGEMRRGFFFTCLYSTAAGMFFLSGWAFRALHFNGYSKAQEGRPDGSAPERLARRLAGKGATAEVRGHKQLDKLAKSPGFLSFNREMRRKDALTFIRDTAQWTQLILLGALIVIYLLNFKYLQTIGDGGIIGPVGLYFCNLGLSGFVITAICVRFVFPSVSLEGRAFWLIRSAPTTTASFLRSKWWALLPGIWLVGQTLTFLSNVMIGTGSLLIFLAMILQTCVTIGIVGVGIGLGAIYPRFNSSNAAQIATGFGGFVYMVSGVMLCLVSVLLSIYPTFYLLGSSYIAWRHIAPPNMALVVGLGFASLALPLAVSLIIIRVAGARLEQR